MKLIVILGIQIWFFGVFLHIFKSIYVLLILLNYWMSVLPPESSLIIRGVFSISFLFTLNRMDLDTFIYYLMIALLVFTIALPYSISILSSLMIYLIYDSLRVKFNLPKVNLKTFIIASVIVDTIILFAIAQ